MPFQTQESPDGIVVITCPGQLTVRNSKDLKKIFADFVAAGKYKFVADLSATRYVDSSGLGAIVSRISLCRSNKGDVRIVTQVPLIKSLLNVTNLNKILKCFDDLDSALADF